MDHLENNIWDPIQNESSKKQKVLCSISSTKIVITQSHNSIPFQGVQD